MSAVESAIHIVLSILLMVGAGMLLSRVGWIDEKGNALLSRLVVKVALPCMIVNNLFKSYTAQSLVENLPGVAVSLGSILLTLLLSLPLARLMGIPRERRGVFTCMFAFSNSVFIGVPVSRALFGDEALPYTLIYYIANTTVFWSAGYALMRRDSSKKERLSPSQKLKTMLPAPLSVFLLCVLLIFLGLSMPKFVLDATGYVGNLVTPLSLIYTGAVLMRMLNKRAIRWQKGYTAVLFGRFVVSPALLLLTVLVFPVPEIMRNALMVQSAMPVMSQTAIVAASVGSDEEYAAGGNALSTAISLLFIPLYMLVIERFL